MITKYIFFEILRTYNYNIFDKSIMNFIFVHQGKEQKQKGT